MIKESTRPTREGDHQPPRALIVIGHGREESLCHHILRSARDALVARGMEVRIQDLLADGFDPVLRIPGNAPHALPEHTTPLARRYQDDVRWMDGILVIHPVWWFAPPAILKGWVDQVLVHGVAIEQRASGPPRPLLGGRRALLIQTFNCNRAVDRILLRGMSESFWRRGVFLPVGILRVERLAFHGVDGMTPRKLAALEAKVSRAAGKLL